jgi:uncharacterized glyoxalase superfamily protein PhnB
MPVKPAIIPCLRYRNAPAAIDFLCRAFGFERHAVYADDQDPSTVHHAQLVDRGCMIMLASAGDSEWSEKAGMKSVAAAGGNTQAPYIVIDDVDAHAAGARAAGAEIIVEPADQDYGGRVYSARDPEGYVWSFGSYDPWAETQA